MTAGQRPYEIALSLGVAANTVHRTVFRLRQHGALPPPSGAPAPFVQRRPRQPQQQQQQQQRQVEPPPPAEKIPCLRCRRDFPTKCRVRNRICDLCKGSETWG